MWTVELTNRGWEVKHNHRTISIYKTEAEARSYRDAMAGRDWN